MRERGKKSIKKLQSVCDLVQKSHTRIHLTIFNALLCLKINDKRTNIYNNYIPEYIIIINRRRALPAIFWTKGV